MRGAYETPQQPCPYCSSMCDADWCDVGVGMQQVGPYYCHECRASEASPYNDDRETRADFDAATGWYKPGSPIDDLANKDSNGNPIGWQEADTERRQAFALARSGAEKRGARRNEITYTRTANPFNSTPFTACCGVAALDTDRCPNCEALILRHDDGLDARRKEVGPGNCLMCGKRRSDCWC